MGIDTAFNTILEQPKMTSTWREIKLEENDDDDPIDIIKISQENQNEEIVTEVIDTLKNNSDEFLRYAYEQGYDIITDEVSNDKIDISLINTSTNTFVEILC